ncbi:MAG: PfkB family carbohydrate kinase [Pseudomonadota bacterium]
MAKILAVGNATLDIINVVDNYPHEDQEVRAVSQHTNRGGNAANTLVVLSQLGHSCSWAGTIADEPGGEQIRRDLRHNRIDLSAVYALQHGKVPTSYVTLSRLNGSRTIVHFRDLPEYPARHFAAIDLDPVDWLHFEGRNLDQVRTMMEHARSEQPNLPISLEVEKARPGIEKLFPLADLLMFSRDYAKRMHAHSAESFLRHMQTHGLEAMMSCTWGEQGAYALDTDGTLHHAPPFSPPMVVDTLGAGDVFNAGLIDQLERGHKLDLALIEASRLAGKKCGIYGLDNLV